MSDFDKKVLKIASRATKEAQKKSLKNGIPNVYSKNNNIFFQLPDGTITQEEPEMYKNLKL